MLIKARIFEVWNSRKMHDR